jgi:hypothetical protein
MRTVGFAALQPELPKKRYAVLLAEEEKPPIIMADESSRQEGAS